ncbi:MAG: hypothetical protein A2504_01245 [Bdellovibrionales bacterium RIFOXYD12_FULL_39_22]|nr:MAG: hypothetical protein A2385_02135 [Bdellovibrionales bacterium RIFOXYB1_FULL_39_21]OFZ42733.1 MAG: hypothetical protein A2485_10320 [Bdellovibrionales bacterium RIFOXYC12_FULL_39_17]OFZ47292.1 MAG: hypothetical protein A2404_14925 [Bdellovibrionales bacterium RIFOXYC1_FULL_39_130]OFZ75458.1 MAG: hypothetical protein A2560_04195 [Bdellovibrionales bacterium RIFOXYD1_FULL_39_84]OFZ93412.1 MAG: hypothetical protein A2504_01245 [Bdellovibrionales bacterium RIFOXYD12_FULL_39_22]
MPHERRFFSKILLFGEYSIIKDSMALATPYALFDGHLKFKSSPSRSSDNGNSQGNEFRAYAQHIENLIEQKLLPVDIDINAFKFDIAQGLFFSSTIPQGFGLGSSGALVAAIYDRYVDKKDRERLRADILKLKEIFALLESHFHGASSGIDPLISYLNTSILLRSKDEISAVKFPDYTEGVGGIFLLNTGRSRRTEPLVNLFLEKCNSNLEFSNLCVNRLAPITNSCINSFLEKDTATLYQAFRDISDFQLSHFTPMIPKLFRDIWERGLKSECYSLKLCGAGGGGFLLGITKNFSDTFSMLSKIEVRSLFKF